MVKEEEEEDVAQMINKRAVERRGREMPMFKTIPVGKMGRERERE